MSWAALATLSCALWATRCITARSACWPGSAPRSACSYAPGHARPVGTHDLASQGPPRTSKPVTAPSSTGRAVTAKRAHWSETCSELGLRAGEPAGVVGRTVAFPPGSPSAAPDRRRPANRAPTGRASEQRFSNSVAGCRRCTCFRRKQVWLSLVQTCNPDRWPMGRPTAGTAPPRATIASQPWPGRKSGSRRLKKDISGAPTARLGDIPIAPDVSGPGARPGRFCGWQWQGAG
jgi:hypothetical protein